MTQRIAGPGVPMTAPANLYPTDLFNLPYDLGTNRVLLQPGCALGLPPGDQLIDVGGYSVLQYLDPISGTWQLSPAQRGQAFPVFSNGANQLRIANLTSCPIGAYVSNGGSGYAQATTTVVATIGGSTWQPIVGGSLSVKTIANVGASFTYGGIVMIPDPPAQSVNGYGGVPATGYFTIANGTVAGVTLGQVGAGYTASTIVGLCLPSPWDPAYGAITPGTVNFTLGNAGAITAVLPTYNGSPLATISTLTLTASGAGSSAVIDPVVLQSIKSASVVAGGGGWGNVAEPPKVTSTGGSGTVGAISNPTVDFSGFRPRDANISATTNSGGTIGALTIIDSGLFVSAPTACIIPGGALPATLASIAFTMGGVNDTIFIQPL